MTIPRRLLRLKKRFLYTDKNGDKRADQDAVFVLPGDARYALSIG